MPVTIIDIPGNEKPGLSRPNINANFQALKAGVEALEGSGLTSYSETISSAATLWTINHNLGRYPAVDARSPGGVTLFGASITHISVNQLTLQFDAAQTGSVRCF